MSSEAKVRLNYSVFNASVYLFGLVADSERRHTIFLMVRRRPKAMTMALLERLGLAGHASLYIFVNNHFVYYLPLHRTNKSDLHPFSS